MVVHTATGSGGGDLGGLAVTSFTHGSGQVEADLVVEWDLDGDGDFSESEEDITTYLMTGDTLTGRDFPSQLTGKAGAGQLKLVVDNSDGRFSRFNTDSPLNTPPFAIRNGGRIRVRTSDAADPDPVLLARDRFRGSGELGTDELGNVWTTQGDGTYSRQEDSTGRSHAVNDGNGTVGGSNVSTATLDVGAADFYLQTRIRAFDFSASNSIGPVYRWEDSSNYGRVRLDDGGLTLKLIEVNAGVTTTTATLAIEPRDDVTLGLLVDGSDATVFLEGVPVIEAAAFSSSATLVGLRSQWTSRRQARFNEFYVWDRLAADPVEGILWTGKVTALAPRTEPGGPSTVTISAEGPLLDAAKAEINPPATVGDSTGHSGMTTGLLVGASLSAAQLLHPPGPISAGSVTPGPVGQLRTKSLDSARLFEEAELGFLHETQEGRIGYDGRGDRIGAMPVAVFSDMAGAQFGYSSLELGDWRREVFNRIIAGKSPDLPTIHFMGTQTGNGAAGVDTNISVTMPTVGNGAVEGDLVMVVIASTVAAAGVDWLTPIGWKSYRNAGEEAARLRIYGKRLEVGDIGASVLFYNDANTGGAWVAMALLFKHWFGDVDGGVIVAEPTGFGQPNTGGQAFLGQNNPPPVFPSWGPGPSLFFCLRAGFYSTGGTITTTASDATCPHGYGNPFGQLVSHAGGGTGDVFLQRCLREACVQVERPTPFGSGAGVLTGFDNIEVVTFAVRGFAGDPPEATGGQIFQVDDPASQDAYDTVLTHDNAAKIFANETDARAYADAVLLTHRGERPIFTLSFPATLNEAYRNQAKRRRVSDKIALVANGTATNNGTGMGVTGEFFIETISHSWTHGGKQWWVTWQLSPA